MQPMFRFAGPPAPPDDPSASPTGADPSAPSDPTSDPTQDPGSDPTDPTLADSGGSKVPQQNAGYMDPQGVPFECDNCKFWQEPNSCSLVDGTIDPAGCCNLWTSPSDAGSDQTDPSQAAPPTSPDQGSLPPQGPPTPPVVPTSGM